MSNVKTKLDGRKTLYLDGQYWDWNPVYKVYNSRKDMAQLQWGDLSCIRSRPKKRR